MASTSNVNPYNINGSFPIAGQDNDSQGFRDNFTNIRTNFTFVKNEITDLQQKAILKTSLTGDSLDNDFNGALVSNARIKGFTSVMKEITPTPEGLASIDITSASVNLVSATGTNPDITLELSAAWPDSEYMAILVRFTTTDTDQTLTMPAEVSVAVDIVQGWILVGGVRSQTILFPAAGDYWFEFSSVDGGNSVMIRDLSRAPLANVVNALTAGTAGTAATVTANAQPNITSVGILTGLNVQGTITTSSQIIGSIQSAGSADNAYTVTSAAQPAITSVGTLTGLTVTNPIVGSVTGSSATAATVTDAAQPTITSVGTLLGLSVSSPINGSITGAAATATTAGSATTAATVTNAAQPTITSVGELTSLTVAGNVTAAGFIGPARSVNFGTLTSSKGSAGDVAGMVRADANYLYICIAAHDGTADIWKRVSLGVLTPF